MPITGLASDSELVERLDLQRSSYEGPTGVVGVLHDACNRRGMPSASLWAAVPHYVAAVPNPKAALALLRRLEGLVGVAFEASGLEEESESFEQQVSNAVSANPEIQDLVQRLEQQQAEQLELGEDIPSGEALAKDFERFLRQRGEEPGAPWRRTEAEEPPSGGQRAVSSRRSSGCISRAALIGSRSISAMPASPSSVPAITRASRTGSSLPSASSAASKAPRSAAQRARRLAQLGPARGLEPELELGHIEVAAGLDRLDQPLDEFVGQPLACPQPAGPPRPCPRSRRGRR